MEDKLLEFIKLNWKFLVVAILLMACATVELIQIDMKLSSIKSDVSSIRSMEWY
jgi:hypothetical protein